MKSLHVPDGVAGNVKLRGKKTCNMSCGCCVAQNFAWAERVKEADQEISDFVNGKLQTEEFQSERPQQ